MPRDIPIGTLSQMGTFIVHRLINEQDKNLLKMQLRQQIEMYYNFAHSW